MLTVTVDKSDVLKTIPKTFNRYNLNVALTKWEQDIDSKIVPNISGKIIDRRTGQMARGLSWANAEVSGKGDAVLTLKSTSPQALLLEHGTAGLPGGVLRPKTAKFLTIPLPAAMTAGGVLKKSAREWDNTFIRKSKKGNLIIFQTVGKGKIMPLFLLRKSIKMEPKRWFSISVDEALPMLKTRILDEEKRSAE